MRSAAALLTLFLAFPFNQALAWWDEGHMQIAYVAYQRLNAPVKDKVDALLKLNGDYALWTAGAPDEATAKMYAFVHAATWADDIKAKSGYVSDNANGPDAGYNIGYVDKNRHALQGHDVLARWDTIGNAGSGGRRHPAQTDDRSPDCIIWCV
jgi:hypothetical protein